MNTKEETDKIREMLGGNGPKVPMLKRRGRPVSPLTRNIYYRRVTLEQKEALDALLSSLRGKPIRKAPTSGSDNITLPEGTMLVTNQGAQCPD